MSCRACPVFVSGGITVPERSPLAPCAEKMTRCPWCIGSRAGIHHRSNAGLVHDGRCRHLSVRAQESSHQVAPLDSRTPVRRRSLPSRQSAGSEYPWNLQSVAGLVRSLRARKGLHVCLKRDAAIARWVAKYGRIEEEFRCAGFKRGSVAIYL